MPTSARPRSTRTSRRTPCGGSTASFTRGPEDGAGRQAGTTANGMSGSAAVAVRRTSYPQVDPRAAGLMHPALVLVPARLTVGDALRSPRAGAPGWSPPGWSGWAGATRETLSHARDLGLGRRPSSRSCGTRCSWPPVPPRSRSGGASGPIGPSCWWLARGARGRHLPRALAAGRPPAVRRLATRAPRPAGARGPPARGGARRRARASASPPSAAWSGISSWIESGSGPISTSWSRAAPPRWRIGSPRLSGRAVEHPAFLTATVTLPDGRRIDLATARRESYRAPGALPSVEPATLADDLARRDFSLNALAIRLDPAAWGRLVDTTGGLPDLRARRLRILHPLLVPGGPDAHPARGAPATRLGCRIDATTRRLAIRAAKLDVYRALSADRLRAELDLILAEPRPAAALREAGRLGAWSLFGLRRPARSARTARLLAPPSPRGRSPPGPGHAARSVPPRARRESARRAWAERARPAAGAARGHPAGASRRAWAPRPACPRPRTGRRVHDPRGRAGDDVAWARSPRGPAGPAASGRASPAMAATFAAGDGRRRHRAWHSAGAGRGSGPEGAPRGAGGRTCPKSCWCVTLADGRRRPGPRARGSIAHPTG